MQQRTGNHNLLVERVHCNSTYFFHFASDLALLAGQTRLFEHFGDGVYQRRQVAVEIAVFFLIQEHWQHHLYASELPLSIEFVASTVNSMLNLV